MNGFIDHLHDSELQALTAPPVISTIHKSLQHLSSSAVPWQRILTVEILQIHALRSCLHSLTCRTLVNWQLNCLLSSSLAELNWTGCPRSLLYNHFARTEQKTPFPKITIVIEAYLPTRFSETGFITSLFCCWVRLCCWRYLATAAVYRVTA
jgi:hypothetical protein